MSRNKQKNTPAYLRLYEQLRGGIVENIYPIGSRLPSKRALAEQTGLSVITVEHAMQLLCDEGYAEARPRSGVYVSFRAEDFLAQPPSAAVLPQTLPSHDTGGFPFSVMARAMRRVLMDYEGLLLTRSPGCGCPELQKELSAYLERSRGIRVLPEQIVVGAGAEYLYGLIAQLLGCDTVFAIEDPCYQKILQVYSAHGVPLDPLPMKPEGIDSIALNSSSAAVLHITPFNSYPSGVTVNATKKREYLSWAEKRGGWIVEDNYASELTVSAKPEESLFMLSGGQNVIYVNTFTHTIAPSMRMGYMVLPESLLSRFQDKLGFYACTVPVFEQYVLCELLRRGDYERHLNRVRRRLRKTQG